MFAIRQTRIFVPRNTLFNHPFWAESIIGHIIAPLVASYRKQLSWFWFTRYDLPPEEDSDDCDMSKIPVDFMDGQTRFFRSMRFRYSVASDEQSEFEDECTRLINSSNCAISDFRPYDLVTGLGDDRHLEENRTPERREERSDLVVQLYHRVAKLILHAIVGPDSEGRYCLPHHILRNPDQETPFHVFHHIYCNATDVPLYVRAVHHAPGGARNPPQHSVQFHRVFF